MNFRDLKADEIELRVAKDIKGKGCSLLCYKDARCDMNILDETVGSMNWQRHHTRDNANCIVSIWDSEKSQWIEKEDTGKESYSEAEKGLASDSFKRACFNWGIGRELYTAPFIWISEGAIKRGEKDKIKSAWYVKSIEIQDKKIVSIEVADKATNNVVFKTKNNSIETKSYLTDKPKSKIEAMQFVGCLLNDTKKKQADVESYLKAPMEKWTDEQFTQVIEMLRGAIK